MTVKYDLIQVLPSQEGWVVIAPTSNAKTFYVWEPVYAVALCTVTWFADGAIKNAYQALFPITASPLMHGMGIYGQDEDFGVEMKKDNPDSYDLLHWSKVADYIKDKDIEDKKGLLAYVASFQP